MPMLMFLLVAGIYITLILKTLYSTAKDGIEEEDLEKADFEDLRPFSEAMTESDRQELIDNEKYFKEKYGLQLLTERSFERFKNAKTTDNGNKLI
jgi:hypothetical protein